MSEFGVEFNFHFSYLWFQFDIHRVDPPHLPVGSAFMDSTNLRSKIFFKMDGCICAEHGIIFRHYSLNNIA